MIRSLSRWIPILAIAPYMGLSVHWVAAPPEPVVVCCCSGECSCAKVCCDHGDERVAVDLAFTSCDGPSNGVWKSPNLDPHFPTQVEPIEIHPRTMAAVSEVFAVSPGFQRPRERIPISS